MKYQVRKYVVPTHDAKGFEEETIAQGIRIFSTHTGDEQTIFITNLKVEGYYGEIGVIENDDGLDNIRIIKEPFIQQPITLKELVDIEPDFVKDLGKLGKLDKMQQELFNNRYRELDNLFQENQSNLQGYKQDLIKALVPAVKNSEDIIRFQKTQETLQNLIIKNQDKLSKIEKALDLIEAEYTEALGQMKTDEERKRLKEQTEKSRTYYELWRTEILGTEINLIGQEAISSSIVDKIRQIAEDYPKEYQLLNDVSETRQLLSYVRNEPYQAEELTIIEMLEVFQTPKNEIEDNPANKEELLSEEVSGAINEEVEEIAEPQSDVEVLLEDDIEMEDTGDAGVVENSMESETPSQETPVPSGETIRGSKAIASLYKAINADYTPDDEMNGGEEVEEGEIVPDQNQITEERGENKEVTEEQLTTTEASEENKQLDNKLSKTHIILSCAILLLGVGGSWFIYHQSSAQTNKMKEEAVKQFKVLEELKSVKEVDEETYNDLAARFAKLNPETKKSVATGLAGYFTYKETDYMVKRFVKETGVLETYTTDGKEVDFTIREVESIIKNGEKKK